MLTTSEREHPQPELASNEITISDDGTKYNLTSSDLAMSELAPSKLITNQPPAYMLSPT